MISIRGNPGRACDGITRREVLRVGGLSALGLTWPGLIARSEPSNAAAAHGFGRAKACILVYLFGGPSQLDTFDMKPDAPAHFRGEFRPIATSVPGIDI